MPVPSQETMDCDRKVIWHKNGGDDGGIDRPDGVTYSQTVSASASVIFTCTIKPRRWHIMFSSGTGTPG